ncbi:hypothetical protein BG841_10270 [Marinobacter sp. X15-166B]|nr:hypothetical protein BG841_10270 [Marinobacter sp. X15-166B]
MARGTEISDRVIQALEAITMAGGFHTDAGLRVTRGRAELLQVEQTDLPMIAVSTSSSANAAVKPRTVRKTRELEIIGLVDAADRDYEPELDGLDEDIALALSGLTGIDELPGTMNIEISGGEYQPPAGGSNIAGVLHTVTVSYVLTTKPQP